MKSSQDQAMKEFVGFIWIRNEPGIRLTIKARTVAEAKAKVVREYGEGHSISLWNEEDADKPR